MDLLQNIMTWLYGGYISFFSHVIDSYNDAKHSHDGWLYFDTPSFKDYFYTWNIMLQTIKICILQNESIFVTSNLFIGKKDFPLVWWESEQSRVSIQQMYIGLELYHIYQNLLQHCAYAQRR